MRRNAPDKQWLMGLLATVCAEHEVCQKGYRPQKQDLQREQQMIADPSGFFDNLEPLSVADLRRKGSVSFLTKRTRMEMELARINER